MNRNHIQHIVLTALLVLGIFGLNRSAMAQINGDSIRVAIQSTTPLGLTVAEGLGRQLLFDYSVPEAGVDYRMHVTLRSNEVSWTELLENGRSETDVAQSVKLDEHRLMMSWFEESGQFVVLFVDFHAGQTTYCGLMRPGVDTAGVCYTGTVGLPD